MKTEEKMIKGAQKRMIVVKTGDSAVFEEAYFVMRRDAVGQRMDMLEEADKIIAGCGGKKRRKLDARIGAWLFAAGTFIGGATVGAAITVIVYAFV